MVQLVLAAALAASPAPKLHLLERHLVLAQLAPPAPIAPPPASAEPEPPVLPPLEPPAPNLAPPVLSPAPPPRTAPPQLRLVDPAKGSLRAGEVLAGSVGSLLASGVGAFVVLGVAATCNDTSGGDACLGAAIGGVLVGSALYVLLAPVFSAAAGMLVGDLPRAGTFGRAVLYGLAAEALEGVLIAVASALQIFPALLVIIPVAQLVGVPIATSLGLHGGNEAAGPDELAPTPQQLGFAF